MRAPWLALVHQLPAHPSNLRVKIWRRLQQLGAVAVKNAVHVLPDSDQAREDFEWLRTEITALGGQATIFYVEAMSDEREVIDAFKGSKARQYKALLKEVRVMTRTLKSQSSQHADRRLSVVRALQERFEDVSAHDFFNAAGRREVEAALRQLAGGRSSPGKSQPLPAEARLDPKEYRNRVWVTRPRPGVDRFASAWLIRRFIDREARFVFAPDPARYPDAIPFDMYVPAGFRHEGDLCTFEVMQERFGIHDKAVTRIAEIVHDVDLKENRYKSSDAPTVRRVVDGLRAATPDDARLLEHGITFFEALYLSFRDQNSRRTPTT